VPDEADEAVEAWNEVSRLALEDDEEEDVN
jgi:hypothetical protein